MAAQSKNCFERYEKKYRLTAAQQRMVLEGMRPYMKKDAYGAYTICNIYYDTDDWRLIRASLEKPVYKGFGSAATACRTGTARCSWS